MFFVSYKKKVRDIVLCSKLRHEHKSSTQLEVKKEIKKKYPNLQKECFPFSVPSIIKSFRG